MRSAQSHTLYPYSAHLLLVCGRKMMEHGCMGYNQDGVQVSHSHSSLDNITYHDKSSNVTMLNWKIFHDQ